MPGEIFAERKKRNVKEKREGEGENVANFFLSPNATKLRAARPTASINVETRKYNAAMVQLGCCNFALNASRCRWQ